MRVARWTVVVLLPLMLVLLWRTEPSGRVLAVYRAGPNVVEVSVREPLTPADFEALQARYAGVERIRVYGYAPGTTLRDSPTSYLTWDAYRNIWATRSHSANSHVRTPRPRMTARRTPREPEIPAPQRPPAF